MSNTKPQFDLVGPTLDDDVRRLIGRYGGAEVKLAVKRQTAGKRGRVPVSDWPELLDVLREDARNWLEGGPLLRARSNRSIALGFAADVEEHNREAIYARLMRKLRERRHYYALVDAEHISYSEYPHGENLRTIRALRDYGIMRDRWFQLLGHRESSLMDYKRKLGEPPKTMTMQDLVIAASTPILAKPALSAENALQMRPI
ncbi:MAG: hypothetical protein ABIT09_07075 [Croceibacterium sp.]